MGKYMAFIILAAVTFTLTRCSSSKKTAGTATAAKTTYTANLSTLIMSYCTPCHVPSKGGNKRPYDNYENARTDIDEMIRRIELNPGERGFMPFKREKLSDSVINAFKQWKADGLLEK